MRERRRYEISTIISGNSVTENKIKVLVATTALGMGYDKPDWAVLHYQAPSSIVAYYQQVGRAGRGIENAIGVLMSGTEDNDIHAFFRRTAFPSQDDVQRLLAALEDADGLSLEVREKQTCRKSE